MDPLARLAMVVDFELFRPDLEAALARSDRAKGGRPPYDAVPDANTIWTFREALTKAGAIERLFELFDRKLRVADYRCRSIQRNQPVRPKGPLHISENCASFPNELPSSQSAICLVDGKMRSCLDCSSRTMVLERVAAGAPTKEPAARVLSGSDT